MQNTSITTNTERDVNFETTSVHRWETGEKIRWTERRIQKDSIGDAVESEARYSSFEIFESFRSQGEDCLLRSREGLEN
jgi:hypothetical protein